MLNFLLRSSAVCMSAVSRHFSVHRLSLLLFDAGRVYVDQKLFVNCFSSLPQLPMESSGNLLNQDRAAPVRCSYKLCIAVALEPPSILTA
jgi:hypothetical protein